MWRNALPLSWNQALIPKCLFKHSKDKCSLIFFPIHLSFSFLLSYHEFLIFQDTLCHLSCTHKWVITITEKHASCHYNNHFELIVSEFLKILINISLSLNQILLTFSVKDILTFSTFSIMIQVNFFVCQFKIIKKCIYMI